MSSAHILKIGDRVRWDGVLRTVTAVSGTCATVADAHGVLAEVPLVELFARAEIMNPGSRPRRLASGTLALLPAAVLEQARWWEGHLVEVITGVAPGAGPDLGARPEYDPAARTLAQREAAKAAELLAAGYKAASAGTVRRKRLRYQARGLEGLIDGRSEPARSDRVDERVVAVLSRIVGETVTQSTRSGRFLIWKTRQAVEAEYGAGVVPLPSEATFRRLLRSLSQGRHVTGSARTRRSMANQPRGPHGVYTLVRPGELVEIDSTPLDVAVLMPGGVVGRVELTGMIDAATRTVTAAVLRPTTKAVDAALLLARTVTPEPMRPGWAEALRMSRSVLPYRSLLAVDDRVRHAAARPVIVPEVIVCDQGSAFISETFRTSCQQLGIDLQPAHPGSPAEKPHVERMMSSIGTLFAQYVSGYLGSSVERRGYRVEHTDSLWSLPELQELLDEWIVAAWQNRPHDGLRDPLAPGRMFTPNEKYAALVQAAGYVPIALGADDYVELLPATWRAVTHYGIKIDHRVYDGAELNPFRRQRSGVAAKHGLWEVHRDPYDISRIWVRDHWKGEGWITVYWKHLRTAPAPFGELAWNHAAAQLRDQGANPTEAEIARAVDDLLVRAHHGPAPTAGPQPARPAKARERRVAARTRATEPSIPADILPPERDAPAPPSPDPEAADSDESPVIQVVALGVFDPVREARKWL